jgi:type IV fimbrial biogenesis protein FimT
MCKTTIKPGELSHTSFIASDHFLMNERGLSLIDLLFALALSGILLSLAFPVYIHVMVEIRLLALTEKIKTVLTYAKNEAVKQRIFVIICKSSDGKTCSGDWQEGWIVFVGKYSCKPLARNVLNIGSPLHEREFLKWHSAGGRDYVQFNPDGSASGHNGSFVTCMDRVTIKSAWQINVSPTGRIRIDKKIINPEDCHV